MKGIIVHTKLSLITLVLILVVGCDSAATNPTATDTPLPASDPISTLAAMPTQTATPHPTLAPEEYTRAARRIFNDSSAISGRMATLLSTAQRTGKLDDRSVISEMAAFRDQANRIAALSTSAPFNSAQILLSNLESAIRQSNKSVTALRRGTTIRVDDLTLAIQPIVDALAALDSHLAERAPSTASTATPLPCAPAVLTMTATTTARQTQSTPVPITISPTRALATARPQTTPAQTAACPQGCAEPPPGCTIKGNISASGEKIYHIPGGDYYDKTRIDPPKGERWFCTPEEALNNGWKASQK